ncbi:MAG: DUF721 domain-containing protein [Bryobacteraceae bacterium]|nr:DUF721 domain-containing protein [Bryobacteraceae bacterium]
MERASRVLSKLKFAAQDLTSEQLATAAWPVAVGKTIARHTTALNLVRGRLVVEVEDATWQRQLWILRDGILRNLDKALGQRPPVVSELEFRIARPLRKPVTQALTSSSQGSAAEPDEADAIRDASFRNIYKTSRRKATA